MFRREHHQRIEKVLLAFNSSFLLKANCFFGGGTAIVLSLDEYRESVDIDFLCAGNDGYKALLNTVDSNGLGEILQSPVRLLREVKRDRYGIRTVLEVDGVPVKLEFVHEARIPLSGAIDSRLHVPTLSTEDMFAEKLLANADRGTDKSTMSRDLIDLSMLINRYSEIPRVSLQKAYAAYGEQLLQEFYRALNMLSDPAYLSQCLQKMKMDAGLSGQIVAGLEKVSATLFVRDVDVLAYQRRVERLDQYKNTAGATYTFWKVAKEAIAQSGNVVSWPQVEQQAMCESILKHGQPAEEVASALCSVSPGCVLPQRQQIVHAQAGRIVAEDVASDLLLRDWDDWIR